MSPLRLPRILTLGFVLGAMVSRGLSAEEVDVPARQIKDELVVEGDRLRGEVIEITDEGVRFKTVYGEGELFVPLEKVDRLTRNGVEQAVQDTEVVADSTEPVVGVATNVVGTGVSTNDPAQSKLAMASPEGIDARLQEIDQLQASWVDQLQNQLGIEYFHQANDWLDEKLRLRLGLAYTSLGLYATDAPYGEPGAASGDLDFFGRWRAWGQRSGNSGTINFNLRYRHRYTDIPPSDLNSTIGSPWPVTAGFDNTGLEVTQAYLDQYFLDGNVGFRIGQIFQDLHFDTYSFKSQKLFFLNSAFSDNPAVAFPDAGVGLVTLIRPVEDWYIISGLGDSQARKLESTVDALFDDKLFSGLELGWSPSRGVLKDQSFSVFGWFSPAGSGVNEPDGSGVTFTYEWNPTESNFSTFLRYAWSASSATLARQLVTGGLVWKDAFGFEDDYFGVAVGWGEPSGSQFLPPDGSGPISVTGGGQGVIEVFHRFQITPVMQITPDIQLLIQPSYNLDADVVAVFGLRARVAL